MAGVQKGILYKPQENSKGKLRLLLYKKSAMSGAKRPLEIVPLLAEPDELKNDKDWRDRLEFRASEFKKRARYAILLDSAWQDVVKDIYISDVVRCTDDDGHQDWLAGVQSFDGICYSRVFAWRRRLRGGSRPLVRTLSNS